MYIDDLIISGSEPKAISEFKIYLGKCFYMKDLGSLKYVLGVEVSRKSKGIFLSQQKYTLNIISEVGLLGSKHVGM